MTQPMRISPEYTVDHWNALSFTVEEDWQKAVNILEDRLRGRFFDIVEKIEHHEFAGFAVLALDCLLIETLQQFRQGRNETPTRQSPRYFVDFLTQTSFGKHFDEPTAEQFYVQVRCGILHQAEVKKNSRVRIDTDEMVRLTPDGQGMIINRKKFHQELETVFEQYLAELRNPANSEQRAHFRAKMNHICRVSGGG